MISLGDVVYSHRLEGHMRITDFQTEYMVMDGRETNLLYVVGETESGEEVRDLFSNVNQREAYDRPK